jgi:hypothetical protein
MDPERPGIRANAIRASAAVEEKDPVAGSVALDIAERACLLGIDGHPRDRKMRIVEAR